MSTGTDGAVLGIVGGMGPYASVEFLLSVYREASLRSTSGVEQALPRCLLDSDPTFPDRTEAIRHGRHAEMTDRLRSRIRGVLGQGASRVVLTCITAHHFAAALEPELRRPLISLVDTVIDQLQALDEDDGPFLMLATSGTRTARVFDRSPRWPSVAGRIVMPEAAAQADVHRLLYRLKQGTVPESLLREVEVLAREHGCGGIVAGCTEAHLLTRPLRARPDAPAVIDPLDAIAVNLDKLLDL
ncbi:aspartate/glutamate racemase family protein [Micromonospora sp. BQ11]|uniref:aspartate/glutamate racemase family protein n=1 Tax=Micromonospora sp. BQ11 TaxID=3452212 RepID=UPI003F89ED3A